MEFNAMQMKVAKEHMNDESGREGDTRGKRTMSVINALKYAFLGLLVIYLLSFIVLSRSSLYYFRWGLGDNACKGYYFVPGCTGEDIAISPLLERIHYMFVGFYLPLEWFDYNYLTGCHQEGIPMMPSRSGSFHEAEQEQSPSSDTSVQRNMTDDLDMEWQ